MVRKLFELVPVLFSFAERGQVSLFPKYKEISKMKGNFKPYWQPGGTEVVVFLQKGCDSNSLKTCLKRGYISQLVLEKSMSKMEYEALLDSYVHCKGRKLYILKG